MKIAAKIQSLLLALLVGTAALVSAVGFWGYNSLIGELQLEALQEKVDTELLRLEYALEVIDHDVRLLQELPSVALIGDAISSGATVQKEEETERLAHIFEQTLRSRPHIAQARLIGVADGGREIVRVERGFSGPRRVSASDLQRKGEREYFTETLKNDPNDIYHSRINLNREHGSIEVPHWPVLRIAMHAVDSSGKSFGVVILNLDFRSFIDDVIVRRGGSRYYHFIANSDGYYLLHSDVSRLFGFELGHNSRLQADFPEAAELFEGDVDRITLAGNFDTQPSGRLFHFRRIRQFSDGRFLTLGISARMSDISMASQSIGNRVVAVVIAIVAVGLAGAYFVSKRLTQPLKMISEASRRFARGESDLDVPADRADEIGDLGLAFASMKKSLEERENHLVHLNRRLEETNKDLENFSHVSAHELREPLTRIGAMADLVELESEDEIGAESKATLARIRDESQRALRQISDFRVFSRIGGGSLRRERCSLKELVTSLVSSYSDEIARNEIDIEVGELPELEVYQSLVQVLYRNLLENAMVHSTGAFRVIRFNASEWDGECILGVSNTGSSIPKEELENVFNLFTRLDKERNGSGTGLAICRRIVNRHSGKIWAESNECSVSVFFTLG